MIIKEEKVPKAKPKSAPFFLGRSFLTIIVRAGIHHYRPVHIPAKSWFLIVIVNPVQQFIQHLIQTLHGFRRNFLHMLQRTIEFIPVPSVRQKKIAAFVKRILGSGQSLTIILRLAGTLQIFIELFRSRKEFVDIRLSQHKICLVIGITVNNLLIIIDRQRTQRIKIQLIHISNEQTDYAPNPLQLIIICPMPGIAAQISLYGILRDNLAGGCVFFIKFFNQ